MWRHSPGGHVGIKERMDLTRFIRDVPDFPEPGILFKDITPLLGDANAFDHTISELVERYKNAGIDAIVPVESRGFLFGAPLARELRKAIVPVRKPGKLPAATLSVDYELEYGTDRVEMHVDAVQHEQRVLLVDDLLATGGTADASLQLLRVAGRAHVIGCSFVI